MSRLQCLNELQGCVENMSPNARPTLAATYVSSLPQHQGGQMTDDLLSECRKVLREKIHTGYALSMQRYTCRISMSSHAHNLKIIARPACSRPVVTTSKSHCALSQDPQRHLPHQGPSTNLYLRSLHVSILFLSFAGKHDIPCNVSKIGRHYTSLMEHQGIH
jgi:hypothetical protein